MLAHTASNESSSLRRLRTSNMHECQRAEGGETGLLYTSQHLQKVHECKFCVNSLGKYVIPQVDFHNGWHTPESL